jgi:hypothetical protein
VSLNRRSADDRAERSGIVEGVTASEPDRIGHLAEGSHPALILGQRAVMAALGNRYGPGEGSTLRIAEPGVDEELGGNDEVESDGSGWEGHRARLSLPEPDFRQHST